MKIPLAAMTQRARPRGRRKAIAFQPIALPAMRATDLYRAAYRPVIELWTEAALRIEQEYARSLNELQTDSAATLEVEIERAASGAGAIILAMRARIEGWAQPAEAWHRARWRRTILSGTGVDLGTFLGPQDVRETLETVIARNVALVRNVSDQTRQRIADAVFRGLQNRTPSREVAKQIQQAVGMGRQRALRIAADQNVKLSSALNEERRRQAGIDSWAWVHSGKVHFRPEHEARDGKLYSEDPDKVGTEYEGKLVRKVPDDKPGELPYCGCTTRAVLILENEQAASQPPPPVAAPTSTRTPSVSRPRRILTPPATPIPASLPPNPTAGGFTSPINAGVTEATIAVSKRLDLQKRMTAELRASASDPRYSDVGKYRGRSEKDFGKASFSSAWSDEAVSAISALKPELDNLADQIGIPRIRGFKTTAGSQNADMGGGVMALSPGEFNARSAKIGGGGSAQLAERARDEADNIRNRQRELQPKIQELQEQAFDARAAGDTVKFAQLKAMRDPLVKEYNSLYNKRRKILESAMRAERVSSTPQTAWRPGDDPKVKPWSVAHYYPEGLDRVRSTLFHEFAHHVHQNLNRTGAFNRPLEARLRQLWAETRDMPNHRNRLPSAYSHTNQHEWFAESFSLFVMGKKDLADPVLVELIERIFRGEFNQ